MLLLLFCIYLQQDILAHLWHSFLVFFDRRKFLKNNKNLIENTRTHFFSSNVKLKATEIDDTENLPLEREASLFRVKDKYVLTSWGILDDDERNRLLMKQESNEARRILAIEIVNHQLNNILVENPTI